eukprot:UN13716
MRDPERVRKWNKMLEIVREIKNSIKDDTNCVLKKNIIKHNRSQCRTLCKNALISLISGYEEENNLKIPKIQRDILYKEFKKYSKTSGVHTRKIINQKEKHIIGNNR